MHLGDHAKAIDFAETCLRLAKEIDDREWVGLSSKYLGDALFEAGELDRSYQVLRMGLASLDPETMRGAFPDMQWRLARGALALQDVAAARSYAEAARAAVVDPDVEARAATSAALAAVRAVDGATAEAEDLFEQALAATKGTGYRLLAANLGIAFAQFLLDRHRATEAIRVLETAREQLSDALARHQQLRVETLLSRANTLV
jgi:tetratricopeptide (TPR) repeat protein